MNDLRKAAQQALEALEKYTSNELTVGQRYTNEGQGLLDSITALRAALAEPEQEPVAWRTFDGEGGWDYRTYEDNENYAAEWAQRNPRHVGWVEPLYTAPTPRKPQTTHWEGCEAVHPECKAKTELERKSDAIQRLWKERDELRSECRTLVRQNGEWQELNAELVEALRRCRDMVGHPDNLAFIDAALAKVER